MLSLRNTPIRDNRRPRRRQKQPSSPIMIIGIEQSVLIARYDPAKKILKFAHLFIEKPMAYMRRGNNQANRGDNSKIAPGNAERRAR